MPIDGTDGIERENLSSLFVCSFITVVVSVRSGDTLHQHFFRNKTQLFGYTWIESYPSPNAQISFFASWNDAGREQLGNADDNSFRIALNATLLIR